MADDGTSKPGRNPEGEGVESVTALGDPSEALLVRGSLWKAIWIMSWPLMITTVATSIVGMVDMYVSGYLGSAAQATVGLAEQVLFLFMVLIMSLGVGTTAIVSRAAGAGNQEEVNLATAQSLVLAIVFGLVLTLASLAGARFILPLFTSSRTVLDQGALYLGVLGTYLTPFAVMCVANAAFRGIGDARTPLYVVATEVVINIAGDFLTVLGHWPVPGLGVRGIAYSGVAACVAAAAVAVWRIQLSPLSGSLRKLLPVSVAAIRRVVRIGLPSAVQRVSWTASVFVLFFILSRLAEPTAALAAWTIGIRVEAVLFMPLVALSLAVGSIVGQNLGARQVQRACRAGWHMAGIGVALMLALGTVIFLSARALAAVMSHDPVTIEYTAGYLRINAMSEPALAVNMILSGALQGAGETRVPMLVSLFSGWLVRLPVAWVLGLTLGWGPTGVWTAMLVSMVASAVLIAIYYNRGAWAQVTV